jgi:hypothetical protein
MPRAAPVTIATRPSSRSIDVPLVLVSRRRR